MVKMTWWKYAAIGLIAISLLVGMLTPLRPGIIELTPTQTEAGKSVEFEVIGYNSNFDASNPPLAWLFLNQDHITDATKVEVVDYQRLKLTFDIPSVFPTEEMRLARISVNDSENGFITALKKTYIKGGIVDPVNSAKAWTGSVTAKDEIGGYNYPFLGNVYESVRNTFYHVPLWFAMFYLFILGVAQSVKYLRTNDPLHDMRAESYTQIGVLFGFLGIFTGMVWATYTWGKPWSWDIKQTVTAVMLLIYCAYFVLRMSFEDEERRARISSIFNIFAFVSVIPLIYIVPRLMDSLHPGGEGNPAMSTGDLDMKMRVIFYLAVFGWCCMGYWISNLKYRTKRVEDWVLENNEN